MGSRKPIVRVMFLLLGCMLIAVLGGAVAENAAAEKAGQIYLVGERHGDKWIMEMQLERWGKCYHEQGMRHLFVEYGHFTAELLNLWMQEDNDGILEAVYSDWEGTASHTPDILAFYRQLKAEYPETVFHGVDVGHQHETAGKRYLAYLEDNGLADSAHYALAQEAIAQGEYYYENGDHVYRENKMAENFIREYDKLDGADVMGIFGGAHVGLEAMDHYTKTVPSMGNQLRAHYGDIVHVEDISGVPSEVEPLREDTIEVGGKAYRALYFGQQDISEFEGYAYRDFWRLENAYDDFKRKPKVGDMLPYDNYPMPVERGQVFIVDMTKTDGTVLRLYYRSDGAAYRKRLTTEGFALE